jgi:hypothetical protein
MATDVSQTHISIIVQYRAKKIILRYHIQREEVKHLQRNATWLALIVALLLVTLTACTTTYTFDPANVEKDDQIGDWTVTSAQYLPPENELPPSFSIVFSGTKTLIGEVSRDTNYGAGYLVVIDQAQNELMPYPADANTSAILIANSDRLETLAGDKLQSLGATDTMKIELTISELTRKIVPSGEVYDEVKIDELISLQ